MDKVAERWQQSGQNKNLSHMQTFHSALKLVTMFLNSPIQYMQQGQVGLRGLIARRGKDSENVKRVAVSISIAYALVFFI